MSGWQVYLNGKPQPTSSTRTFPIAKQDARRLARQHPQARVIVKDPTGRVVMDTEA